MDVQNPGNLSAIPKITPQHLELTPMAKMRVRLCTQVILIFLKLCNHKPIRLAKQKLFYNKVFKINF